MKNKKKIVAVLLLGVVGVVAYMKFFKKDKTAQEYKVKDIGSSVAAIQDENIKAAAENAIKNKLQLDDVEIDPKSQEILNQYTITTA